MCDFANGVGGDDGFLHPVVRAVLLHFWLAYDHPFEDGNGRTARALFYWSMSKQGYWLTEYLSISQIFRNAPARYGRAFLYAETDDRDSTYFVLFHLAVIKRAIEELHKYLQRKMREVHEFEQLVRTSDRFNYRQLALLGNAARHPDQPYTFRSHATSHNVTFQTARTDLLALRDQGLLEQRKRGRQFVFYPAPDLATKLMG
jgi:Fic family protein